MLSLRIVPGAPLAPSNSPRIRNSSNQRPWPGRRPRPASRSRHAPGAPTATSMSDIEVDW